MTTYEAIAKARAGRSVLSLLTVLLTAGYARLSDTPALAIVGLGFICVAAWTHGLFWGCLVTGVAVLLLDFRSERTE